MHTKRNIVEAGAEVVVTSIRTTRAQLEAFRRVATSEHRSVSQHLRHVMDREVAEHPSREVA